MGDYANRIDRAGIADLVAGIRDVMAHMGPEYLTKIDAEDDGLVPRLELLLDHVLVVTSSIDSRLVPKKWVSDLVEDLAATRAALDSLAPLAPDGYSMSEINNLSTATEELAVELMQWHRIDEGDFREAVTQAASTYRRSAGQQLVSLNQEIAAASAKIDELRELSIDLENVTRRQADERRIEIEGTLAQLGSNVAAMQASLETTQSQIAASVARADQSIAAYQQQFSEAQDARAKEFASTLKASTSAAKATLDASEAEAAALLAAIQQQVDKSAELVSVFAAAGTANAYSKEAKAQSETADRWRITAIVFAVLAAVAALSVLFKHNDQDPAWDIAIAKLAVGAALGGIAGYAASQSARHRHREEAARQIELRIAALGPITQDLSEDDQKVARGKFMETVLMSDGVKGGGDQEPSITKEQIGLVNQLADGLLKVLKR